MQKKFVEKVKEVAKEWFRENPEESPAGLFLTDILSDLKF